MLRTMDLRLSTKTLLLNSTEKVIFAIPNLMDFSSLSEFLIDDFLSLRSLGCRRRGRKFMDLKSTLYIHTSNNITLKLLILTMKRSTKLTSASSIISLVGLSWHTIPAGYHNCYNFYHCSCLIYLFLLVGLKHFQHAQSSLITLLWWAEPGCLR